MAQRKKRTRDADAAEAAAMLEEAAATRRPSRRRTDRTLAILSRKRSLYSTARLVQAARVRGHRAIVMDTLRCTLILDHTTARMTFRGVEVRGIDVVVPRIGTSITPYGLAVVNHFGLMGVPALNAAGPISRSRDKLRSLQVLSRNGIAVPRTVMARDRSHVRELLDEVGGLPAIVKLIRGTQGVGVMIAQTYAELEGLLGTFSALDQDLVLQEFVAESKGRDVRALVVGDRVVGAMRRQAKKGEFRSNLHRGGRGRPVELPREWADVAVKAAGVLGLEVAGVDMLESKEGPKIMEINSSPGFAGLEKATGIDVAGEIVDHAVAVAKRPPARELAGNALF